jgi:hypothetical protein
LAKALDQVECPEALALAQPLAAVSAQEWAQESVHALAQASALVSAKAWVEGVLAKASALVQGPEQQVLEKALATVLAQGLAQAWGMVLPAVLAKPRQPY